MTSRTQKIGFGAFAGLVLLIFYFPLLSVALASLSKKRYFSFPIENYTLKWYSDAIHSAAISEYVTISLKIAALTTVFSLVIGFFAALAYARYPWRGRKSFQRLVLLPLFFPQTVLGLALLMWFSFLGVTTSWMTAVVAHTVWIAPIATLIIAIQAYSLDPSLEEASRDLGATRWQTLRMVTLPQLMPAMAAKPARRPPRNARLTMYSTSGPGVRFSSHPASTNSSSCDGSISMCVRGSSSAARGRAG